MNSEEIHIENFGGMTFLEVSLRQINIFIGPQASGKSITVKLLFFFKNILSDIVESVSDGEDKRTFKNEQLKKFKAYFPEESYGKSAFSISYRLDNSIGIKIYRDDKGKLKLEFTKRLDSIITQLKKIYRKSQEQLSSKKDDYFLRIHFAKQELQKNLYNLLSKDERKFCGKQFFIPAGRSFYANLQANIFSFLSANKTLDPFLIEFGSLYENFKHIFNRRANGNILKQDSKEEKKFNEIEKIISDIVKSSYQRENDKDYLIHSDERKVNLANASSGQQEILPILIILETLLKNKVSFVMETATFFIEEPEAHLFPIAQNKVVKLLARLCNDKTNNYQIFITTHSPYVLASFNNLLLAGNIINKNNKNKDKITKYVQLSEIIPIDRISAYSLSNGKCNNLIDSETNLINAKILDAASEDISTEFDKLLDIEFNTEM